MKLINFVDYSELGEHMYDLVSDGKIVSAVLFKKDIVALLRRLMEYDEFNLGSIDIRDSLVNGYEKEYYLTINDDMLINIEPVYDEDTETIIPCYSDIVLFDGDTSSRIALMNDYGTQFEIFIADRDDDNDDSCEGCCYDCGNCPKATASQTFSNALDFIDYILNHYND